MRALDFRVATVLFLLGGCADSAGDETEGLSETGGPMSGASEGSGATGGGDGDGQDDGNDATGADAGTQGDSENDSGDESGDPPDLPPTPAACEDRELPPRGGAEILVSPTGDGTVTVDGQTTTLRQVVSNAASGDTVLLQDGTYTFDDAGDGEYSGLYFTTPDVTLRSESGDPTAVVLDSAYRSHGGSSAVITIDAPGVVVADLTVQRSIFHLIHLWANGDDAIIHDVHLVDGGQQFLKASPGDGIVDGVEVSCTTFVMTDAGRDNVWGYGPQDGNTTCYTGGIDTHDSTNWNVHDSWFEGIYCDAVGVERPAHGRFPELRDGMTYNGGLAEHCVHMWDSEAGSGHALQRNRFVDCARGIGLGFNGPVHGSSVINNTVFSQHAGSGEHDVGISIEEGVDTLVAHNTVFFSHPDAYTNRIEYRFATTNNLTVHGNLTNGTIAARDGATALLVDNVTEADSAWFQGAASGDLRVSDCASPGAITPIDAVPIDLEHEDRTDPTTPGADHCGGR